MNHVLSKITDSVQQVCETVRDKAIHIDNTIKEQRVYNSNYKNTNTFEDRRLESNRIKEKYPDRVPIICERGFGADIPILDRKKYLVPGDLNIANFLYIIRKRMELSPDKALFLFCNDSCLLPTSSNISLAYEEHKDDDGFLYITYNGESTFG
jgi:GABA(A) receptor-associated protein